MRKMNLRDTNKKKVRGARRKSELMIKSINDLTTSFPETDLNRGYWHMHLPVPQSFIDSEKTPPYVKRLCIISLLNSVNHLISIKPNASYPIRVVACITLPKLWHSQIIVFYENDYFSSFFDRDNKYQRWTALPSTRNISKEWNIELPGSLDVKGYIEEIFDDDYTYKNELWYVGELS